MKKIAFVWLVLSVLLATGCSRKENTDETQITKDNLKVGFVYIGAINDGGYTQAQDAGRKALNAMGIKTAYVENVGENSDCEKAIHDLIDLGCNVIYTTSFGYMDWTIKVAAQYPDIKFGHCSGFKRTQNVSTYFGRMYEARYLAGIVAGQRTKTNKIGYVAAFPLPECIRGINAFTLGVQSVNPKAEVSVIWTNTWYNPAVEKKGAVELLNQGCDVIEQHQNTTACQVAADEQGVWAVGYNTSTPDAAPNAYLTAPLFNWAVFYTEDVQSVLDGTWKSRAYWKGLENGMVSLDKLSENCTPGTQKLVEDAQNDIISGKNPIFTGPLYDQHGQIKIPAGTTMSDEEIWNMNWFVKGVKGIIPAN